MTVCKAGIDEKLLILIIHLYIDLCSIPHPKFLPTESCTEGKLPIYTAVPCLDLVQTFSSDEGRKLTVTSINYFAQGVSL